MPIIPDGAILTKDGLFYLTTEDGLFYIKQQTNSFEIIIPVGGASFNSSCDDGSYFLDYNPENDFFDFLETLGKFNVDWGDGDVTEHSYSDQYFEHFYQSGGTYTITWNGNYAFLSNEYLSKVKSLNSNIKYLYLSETSLSQMPTIQGLSDLESISFNSCSQNKTPPILYNLPKLRYLYMGGQTLLTAPPNLTNLNSPVFEYLCLSSSINLINPPNLKGLSGLRYLDLHGSGIYTPPIITDEHQNIHTVDVYNSNIGIDGVNTLLECFNVLFETLMEVNLLNCGVPSPSVLLAAQTANPQCNFQFDVT
jgi:hypothetical protein